MTGDVSDALSGIASVACNGEIADYVLQGSFGCEVAIVEGPQTIGIAAIGEAGNQTLSSFSVTGLPVDSTPPTITSSISPAANANGWLTSDVAVTHTCADSGSGLSFCGFELGELGGPGETSFVDTLTGEGLGRVSNALAVDNAENRSTATVTVNIDQTPPEISAASAPAGQPWVKDDVTVTFSAFDEVSGIAVLTDPVVVTSEGADQVINGAATNGAGLESSVAHTVSIDKTAPTLTIAEPADGAGFLFPFIEIAGRVSDALSGLATVDCPDSSAALTEDDFRCTVALEPGSNTIDVSATDLAGNVTTETITVSYEAPPQLTITSPADLSSAATPSIPVSGTISDPQASVSVNGAAASVSGSTFSATVSLHSGSNTISAVAAGPEGSQSVATVHVFLDDIAPLITITSPLESATVYSDAVEVSGGVNDYVAPFGAGPSQVTVNGVAAAVTGDRFAATAPILEGVNAINIIATDAAGKSRSATTSVRRETAAGQPTVELVSGDGQSGTIRAALPQPLIARVVDAAGDPVEGASVSFRITRGDGALGLTAE